MDVQLQELIDKIKRDGVASAEESANQIIADAEKKAAEIVKAAEEKADGILKNARAETERMEKASEEAIAQAGRNLILSFRDSVTKELSNIVTAETEKAYDSNLLKKIIPDTVKAWAANNDAKDITVLLPAKDVKALKSSLTAALKSYISKGLELKPDSSINAGFRIGSKNGNAFYDFSAEEVAALFCEYLNPKTAEIMKGVSIEGEPIAEEKTEEKAPAKKTPAKKAPAKKTPAKAKAKAKK